MLFNKIIALRSGKFTEHENTLCVQNVKLFLVKYFRKYVDLRVLVAARYKAWVCGRSLVGVAVSNSTRRHGCLSVC